MQDPTLTVRNLRNAIETRDAAALISFYTPNAVLVVIDQENPPSKPKEIRGREAIRTYFDDVCGRDMTHRVEQGLIDGNAMAFTQRCGYPDGTAVFCSAMLDLQDGRIARQVMLQAWDA